MNMGRHEKFYVVGENIHCTRIHKLGGKYVRENEKGGADLVFRLENKERKLPIPGKFTAGADWQSGKVKHTAVAVWQGLNGDDAAKQAAEDYIRFMVERQEENDASFLDVNVDEFSTDPGECRKAMTWAVRTMQKSAGVPLSIDSSNPRVLEVGLSLADPGLGKPMVNSVSLERKDAVNLAKDAGAVVIANAAGEERMPDTKEERLANLEQTMELLGNSGFKDENIYIDPLVFPVSVDSNNGTDVLETIGEIRERYGNAIHFAPGLSNISFGMPNRKLLNQVFTYLCRERGLDGGIVDPLQINASILDDLDPKDKAFKTAEEFLVGKDMFGKNYITAVRGGQI